MSQLPDLAKISENPAPTVSVIVPLFNEAESVAPLVDQIATALHGSGRTFEIVLVNDGSLDATAKRLDEIAAGNGLCKVVHLRRNFGQTAAIMAGIDFARGDIIVPIDGDLQNDPTDIPRLIAKLDEGYDVCSGWRKKRKDNPFVRTLPSHIANFLISRISGVRLSDYGCTLKAYRRDVIKGVRLYGEMHRFIPIYAAWQGARVTELPVRHHPRQFGKSKYGLERIVKVILDLMVVKFLDRHFVKPIYVFGGFGVFSFALAGLAGLYMLYLKFFEGLSMIQTPLPLLSAMGFLVGVMSLLMGLLAEMLVRIYFESQNRSPYLVRDLTNFDETGNG
jgi:glycosyltransferase involved in cell wall biosynthesis